MCFNHSSYEVIILSHLIDIYNEIIIQLSIIYHIIIWSIYINWGCFKMYCTHQCNIIEKWWRNLETCIWGKKWLIIGINFSKNQGYGWIKNFTKVWSKRLPSLWFENLYLIINSNYMVGVWDWSTSINSNYMVWILLNFT